MSDIVVTIPASQMKRIEEEEARVARGIARGETTWRFFWEMARLPKQKPKRIYFLWDGAIRAYHKVLYLQRAGESPSENTFGDGAARKNKVWMEPEIHEIGPIPMRPFRDFRYFERPL